MKTREDASSDTMWKIAGLMDAVAGRHSNLRAVGFDFDKWRPTGGEEIAAFESLLLVENRESLRRWYQQSEELNPVAEEFRQFLETKLGERLLLKGQS